MTDKFYFYDPDINMYLHKNLEEPTDLKSEAAILTRKQWERWGKDKGFELEPVGQDVAMRLSGMPTLPGLEFTGGAE